MIGGCASGRGPHPVKGQVVWADGQPATELAGGLVAFESVNEIVGAQAQIQPDATFRMSTYTTNDGAIVGKHRVVVAQALGPNPDNLPPPLIHSRFQLSETSGLEVEVKPGTNEITLTVERAPRSGRGSRP
jgi:hypothetical protein